MIKGAKTWATRRVREKEVAHLAETTNGGDCDGLAHCGHSLSRLADRFGTHQMEHQISGRSPSCDRSLGGRSCGFRCGGNVGRPEVVRHHRVRSRNIGVRGLVCPISVVALGRSHGGGWRTLFRVVTVHLH